MKEIHFLIFILILVVSCSNGNKTIEIEEAVTKTDSCLVDAKNTYEVYIPERNSDLEKLPLLIIIDAHGAGKFALEKFKNGANHYTVVLVASNLVKNGLPNYEAAIQTLIEDVRGKYPVNETLFITGFSGGARMALGYSLNHNVDGLILCGALANANQLIAVHCPVISISGTDDFNFIETAQYLFKEKSMPANLKIELTNASHDWPDSLMLSNSLGFLYLSQPSSDCSVPSKPQIETYNQQQHLRIDSLRNENEFLQATLIARNMATTKPFSNDESFRSQYNDLKSDANYSTQLNEVRSCIQFEMKARQPYIDAFSTKDSVWWKNEIKSIREKIDTEQNPFKKDMYKRISAFWGIACYSLGNRAIQEHNAKSLDKIIPIYQMLEPENPYVLYFSAFPYFWKGNDEATISILKKAREKGFTDMSQMKKDFPETITSEIN